MRISRSTGYALLAVGYIARHQSKGVVMSQKISREYEIPLEYLLKILQQLVRANILNSKRGPRGGFSLTRPASGISLLQIIEAVDGPMTSQVDLAELPGAGDFGAKADKIYEKAVAQARAVFAKAKVSSLLA